MTEIQNSDVCFVNRGNWNSDFFWKLRDGRNSDICLRTTRSRGWPQFSFLICLQNRNAFLEVGMHGLVWKCFVDTAANGCRFEVEMQEVFGHPCYFLSPSLGLPWYDRVQRSHLHRPPSTSEVCKEIVRLREGQQSSSRARYVVIDWTEVHCCIQANCRLC